MTDWLIAQLAYDRVRKVLRQDGLSTDQCEAWIDRACMQMMGKGFKYLQSDKHFALHLERAINGNLL